MHVNITAHPTTQWSTRQLAEAFTVDTAPRYMLRDRDAICGKRFRRRSHSLGITEVHVTPESPRHSTYVERLICSIRRECLDHVIVFNEPHLKRLLGS